MRGQLSCTVLRLNGAAMRCCYPIVCSGKSDGLVDRSFSAARRTIAGKQQRLLHQAGQDADLPANDSERERCVAFRFGHSRSAYRRRPRGRGRCKAARSILLPACRLCLHGALGVERFILRIGLRGLFRQDISLLARDMHQEAGHAQD